MVESCGIVVGVMVGELRDSGRSEIIEEGIVVGVGNSGGRDGGRGLW